MEGKTKVKQEIRTVFKFLRAKEQGHDKYGNNGYVILSGKKYFIGCMSYDSWYCEPYYKDRTERSGFHKDTRWESDLELIQIFVDNGLLEVRAK